MAIVFLPLNGIGMGHLSRSFALARQLRDLGELPVVFAQGNYPPYMSREVPGFRLGPIYKAWWLQRRRMAREIAAYARRTHPAVVIDDTHPAPIHLEPDICRVLLLRPTTLGYMRWLRLRHEKKIRRIFIADHPESPTWPFTESQTAEISAWPKWECIGPIFRRASAEGRRRVIEKYSLQGCDVHVFTMGGGGTQGTDGKEIPAFLAQASIAAESIRRRNPASRLLFVRGPLFPRSIVLPNLFEEIATEDDMPSLIAEARGAVIRPGFNTLWECIAGGTPFICIDGQTYREPVADRHRRMQQEGLLPSDSQGSDDPAFAEKFGNICRTIADRWPATHAAQAIQESLAKLTAPSGPDIEKIPGIGASTPRPVHVADPKRSGLVIRVDDVTEPTRELISLFRIAAARGLCLSLEMIPYLCKFDEASLRSLAGQIPGELKYEVSQHGYDHLPRRAANGLKTEFIDAEDCQPSLERGIQLMRQRFPATFAGGFSAPFDGYPPSLCPAWQKLGGRYVSTIWAKLETSPVPAARLTADPWDWRRNKPHPMQRIIQQIKTARKNQNYVGLCLHPQILKVPGQIEYHERLFDAILELGVEPMMLSIAALARFE